MLMKHQIRNIIQEMIVIIYYSINTKKLVISAYIYTQNNYSL